MSNIAMRRVERTYDDGPAMQVGDFFFEVEEDGNEYLVFVTPKKLRLPLPITGPRAWQFDGNRDKPTITPSIWSDKGSHYDWHGFITNGELVIC